MESCWLFLVVSSEGQGDTIPHQRQWANATAAEHGWKVSREFSGVSSGKTGTRKLLETLLSELRDTPKRERPARVLLIRIDRLGRGLALDSVAAIAEIHRLGVMLHTREDGDVKLERASDAILPMLRSITGGLENEARRDKALATHARKRKEGKHAGHAPFGVRLVDGKPVPDENAPVVEEIFNLRLQGWGVQRLARFASQKAPTKPMADGGIKKMKWDESTIQRMLYCKTYRGTVVQPQIWDDVQAVKRRGIVREAKYAWSLRGAVRCSCGRMLSTVFSGPTGRRIRYYTCRNVAVHSNYPYHRADLLEQQFYEMLLSLEAAPDSVMQYGGDIAALQSRLLDCEDALRSIDARRKRVWELAEAAQLPKEEFAARISEIMEERKTAEVEAESLREQIAAEEHRQIASHATHDAVSHAAVSWKGSDVAIKREFAKTFAEVFGGLWIAPKNGSGSMLRTGPIIRS